jgi:hypothetical protein
MMWRKQKLESLASDEAYSFVGGLFGSKFTAHDYLEEGTPVIRGSNLSNGRLLDMSNFVCNRSGIRYATDGMKGSPLKAPPIAMSTASPFFLTVETYPRTLQKFVAPSLLLNVPEIFC